MTLESFLLAIGVLIISAIINLMKFRKMNDEIFYLENENQKLKNMYMDLYTTKNFLEKKLKEVEKYGEKN